MRTNLCLLFLIVAQVASAAGSRIYSVVNVTNTPSQSNLFLLNGESLTWLTNVVFATNQILITNSVGWTKTNLYAHAQLYPFTNGVDTILTSSNAVIFVAQPNRSLTVSISGTWASITYITNPVYSADPVVLDYTLESNSQKTNIASALVRTIGSHSTNALPETSAALSNYVSRGQSQTLGNKVITNSVIDGASISNASIIASNVTIYSGSASNLILTNGLFSGKLLVSNGVITGVTISGSTYSGTVGAMTNGYWTNGALGSPSMTNGQNFGNAFRSPGTGAFSEQFGSGATASGDYSFAGGYGALANKPYSLSLGNSEATGTNATAGGQGAEAAADDTTVWGRAAVASAIGGTAIGTFSLAGHLFSSAVGYSASTTGSNQIRLGRSTDHVSIPGYVDSATVSNLTTKGTNQIQGSIAFPPVTITTAAAGLNTIDPGTNTIVRITGSPGANWAVASILRGWDGRMLWIYNDTGFTSTNMNENGFDATAANRIRTMTGADGATGTNSVTQYFYDGTRSRWIVMSHNP